MRCVPSLGYYARIAPQIQQNYTKITPQHFSVTPKDVKVGDIVELKSNILGIVSFCGLEKFDVVDLDNKKHLCRISDLNFALRPDNAVLKPPGLEAIAAHARALVNSFKPYAQVIYAFNAQDYRANAFDFKEACALLLRSKYKSDPNPTVEQILAIYFLLSTSKRFMRLQGSPFAAKPLYSASRDQKGAPTTPTKNPFRAALGPSKQIVGPGIHHKGDIFPTASFFTSDIGFSLETKYDRFQVNIYLPLIPWRSPLHSVGHRGLSLKGYPLVDYSLRRKFGLQRHSQVSCLVVSALVNPWNNKIVDKNVELGHAYGEFIPKEFFTKNSMFDRKRLDELNNIKQVFDAHVENPQRSDFERLLTTKDPLLARQARHLASVWGSEWAVENGANLCFLRKERLKPFDEIQDENAIETEVLTSIPGPYEHLNAGSYAPLGYVFDSSISAVNAAALAMHLSPNKPLSLKHVSSESLAEVYTRLALPNKQLADCIAEQGRKYDIFRLLDPRKPVFFRCTVLETCGSGEKAIAYCQDLKFDVEVKAPAALEKGDSIVCTKVLEVNPNVPHILLQ